MQENSIKTAQRGKISTILLISDFPGYIFPLFCTLGGRRSLTSPFELHFLVGKSIESSQKYLQLILDEKICPVDIILNRNSGIYNVFYATFYS